MPARKTDWDPLSELMSVQKRMNSLFEDALSRGNFDTAGGVGPWSPVADVRRTAAGLRIDVELPGLDLDRIDVRIEGDDLIVSGDRKVERDREGEQFHRVERAHGRFERRFAMPSDVDADGIEATYRLGVLTIRVPARGRERRSTIKVDVR